MRKIRKSLNNDESFHSFQDLFHRLQQLELNDFGRQFADIIPQKKKHKKIELLKGIQRLEKANQEVELQRELQRAKVSIKELVLKEREGEQIDRIQLMSQIRVFSKNKRRRELESFMLEDAASYYAGKAASWIKEYSCPDYMLQSETSLEKEKERTSRYLRNLKLVKEVENQLLVVVGKQLLENEHSGCRARALLRDVKFNDLKRMYRLYDPIPHGLKPVADLFKQHVTAEGNALIKQAAKAATDQVLIRQLIELRKKYMDYVLHLFQNHTLFHKALKERHLKSSVTKKWLEFPVQKYWLHSVIISSRREEEVRSY